MRWNTVPICLNTSVSDTFSRFGTLEHAEHRPDDDGGIEW